jgi:hypothetical protein
MSCAPQIVQLTDSTSTSETSRTSLLSSAVRPTQLSSTAGSAGRGPGQPHHVIGPTGALNAAAQQNGKGRSMDQLSVSVSDSNELLAAIYVERRASDRRVGHEVDR